MKRTDERAEAALGALLQLWKETADWQAALGDERPTLIAARSRAARVLSRHSADYRRWEASQDKVAERKRTPQDWNAEALAEQTADAYSWDRYRSWPSCCKLLRARGYTKAEAEVILRSKVMRWAADHDEADYGKVPARALGEYLDVVDNAQWIEEHLLPGAV